MPRTTVTLTPIAEPDFAVLRGLADTIWRQHYASSFCSLAELGAPAFATA